MEVIVKKIKETMDVNKDFIDQCAKYLNGADMISYTEVKNLIGYKKKESIQDILSNNKYDFVENTDYKIVKEKLTGVCKPINEIYMTIDTIKCICMMAPTEKSQEFRRYYLQMERIFREFATAEMTNKIIHPVPELNNYEVDISKFKDKDVVYLLKLEGTKYKFGTTGKIVRRLETHKRILGYKAVVKIWICQNRSVTKKIEDNIKLYIKHQKINGTYKTATEVFDVPDPASMIKVIDGYLATFTEEYRKMFQDEKLRQENAIFLNKKSFAEEMNKLFDKMADNDGIAQKIHDMFNKNIIATNKQYDDNKPVIKKDPFENLIYDDRQENEDYNDYIDDNCMSCLPCLKIVEVLNEDIGKNLLRKCQRCKSPHTEEEFGTNKKTDTPYMNCETCRDKQKISDKKRNTNPERVAHLATIHERCKAEKKANPKPKKVKKSASEIKRSKLANKKVYYEKNKEEIRAKQKVHYDKNATEIVEQKREAYKTKQLKIKQDNDNDSE